MEATVPSFDHWTSLFALVAAQGFLLSAMIWLLRPGLTFKIHSIILLLFSVLLTFYVSWWTGYWRVLPAGLVYLLNLNVLIGPLCCSILVSQKRKFIKSDFLHLIPVMLLIVISFTMTNNIYWYIPMLVQLTAYSLWLTRLIQPKQKMLLVGMIAFTSGNWLYFILVQTGLLLPEYDYGISATMAFFIYISGYKSIKDDKWLLQQERIISTPDNILQSIFVRINNHFVENKPYLVNNYRLSNLSSELGLSIHLLSETINKKSSGNFNEFINQHRVSHAKELLQKSELNMVEIADSSGFGNKVSFFQAFKKMTGKTPNEFRKLGLEEVLS